MQHGTPVSITVDHGTELTSKTMESWAWENGVKLDFIHPGKPIENGHIESFSGRMRDECSKINQFLSLKHARQGIEARRNDYNHHQPHSSLSHPTSVEFVNRHNNNRISEMPSLSKNGLRMGETSKARNLQFDLST